MRPSTGLAAFGHFAHIRADDMHAVRAEAAPDCVASPWPPTCAGSLPAQRGRLVGRKQYGAGEIVGTPGRHLGDQVGSRRRNDDEICVARQADMPDIELALRIEQIGIGALASERTDRKRRDEMLRRRG